MSRRVPERVQVVVVIDGLRADHLTVERMPATAALAAQGARYSTARSTALPVTRISAASLVTGRHPGASGLISRDAAFGTSSRTNPLFTTDAAAMRTAAGRVLTGPTLVDVLAVSGLPMVTVTTAYPSIGAILSDGRAPTLTIDLGATSSVPLVNDPAVRARLIDQLGQPTPRDTRLPIGGDRVGYAIRGLIDVVIPDLAPSVVLLWFAELDQAQHRHGVNSPEARHVLTELDRQLSVLWSYLADSLGSPVDVIVCADHGFSNISSIVAVPTELAAAGLAEPNSDTVRIACAGSCLVRLRGPDADAQRAAIAEWAIDQPWVGALFAADGTGERNHDALPMSLVGIAPDHIAPDLILAPAWTDDRNEFGWPGTAPLLTAGAASLHGWKHSGHGAISDHDTHIAFFLWGSAVRTGVTLAAPASLIDIAPTLAFLRGEPEPAYDGRVLGEALLATDAVDARPEVETYSAAINGTRFVARVDRHGRHRYLRAAGSPDVVQLANT